MPLVNLESQPDAVKDFVLSHAADPNGAVMALNGRPVARILPLPANGTSGDEDWTAEKNRRRCALIDQKYDRELSPEEAAELAALQTGLHRYLDRVAPLPIDAARKLHQQLLETAAQSGADA